MTRIVIFCMLTFSFLFAQNIVINSNNQVFDDFKIEMFEDKTASLELHDVSNKSFITISNRISLGSSKSSFWFRFKIQNKTNSNVKYILESTETFIEEVDCFIISKNGNIQKFEKGRGRANQNNIVENKNPQFPINLESGESKEVYIRQFGLFPIYTSLHILSPSSLNKYTLTHDRLMATYFGGALALILYNLFIFLYSRDRTYLYYISYVSAFTLWQLQLNGFPPFEFLYKSYLVYFRGTFIWLSIVFIIIFSCKILDTKKYFPRIDRFLKAIIFIYFILIIYSWFNLYIASIIINGLSTIVLPGLLYIGFISYKKGNTIALFYIIAQLVFLTTSTIFSYMANGTLEYNLLTRHGIVIGSFLEMFLFSLALAYKLRVLQDEKIEIIKQSQHELEIKVAQRTSELKKANEELEALTTTDKLTKIFNRHGIDKNIEYQYKQFKRYKQVFGVIILDIDYFKKVNDEFGHMRGDEVLRSIAQTMQTVTRETDLLGRWGGEEFLVVCPSTNIEGVLIIAETMRKAIESYTFEEVGHKTASFGVGVIQGDETAHNLLIRVDEALYKAKVSGRNRVCS